MSHKHEYLIAWGNGEGIIFCRVKDCKHEISSSEAVRRINATEENHLENILRIMGHDDYDEVIMHRLSRYVASRGLLENYYSELEPQDLASFKREIDTFLASLPPLGK